MPTQFNPRYSPPRYIPARKRSGCSGCITPIIVIVFLFLVYRGYTWFDARSDYLAAEKIGTPAAYRDFITKHPGSSRCEGAAKAGAALAAEGKYLDQWPDLLRALGQYHCDGSVDVLRTALKPSIAEVRVAASGSLVALTSASRITGKQPVVLTDLDPILAQARTDPSPVVRGNLRCVATESGRGNSLDNAERSPYVLAADKSCLNGELGAQYGKH